MKLKIEMDESVVENEVLIKCSSINEEVKQLQEMIQELQFRKQQLVLYQGEKEFYIPVHEILFFETGKDGVEAHTGNESYQIKYRLYELEDKLPSYFLRVSKSCVLNSRAVYSVSKNITAASIVEFQKSYKKVYVSRNYYKTLKLLLER